MNTLTLGFFLKEVITLSLLVIILSILSSNKTLVLRKKADEFFKEFNTLTPKQRTKNLGIAAANLYKKMAIAPVLTEKEKLSLETFMKECEVKIPKVEVETVTESSELKNTFNKIKKACFVILKWYLIAEVSYSQFLVNPNKLGLSLMITLLVGSIIISRKVRNKMTAI